MGSGSDPYANPYPNPNPNPNRNPNPDPDPEQALVEERRSVCWRDVLRLMQTPGQPGGKVLILRPRLFEVDAP